MDADTADERHSVIAGALRLAEAERCTWSFTVQNIAALLLFALSPSIPGASKLFGRLTTPRMFAIVTPAVVAVLLGTVVFRRVGSRSIAYRVCELVQTFLLYGVNVAGVFESRLTWPVLWILCPYSAVFFGVTRPHEPRRITAIVLGAHLALATAYRLRGDGQSERAWLAIGVGVLCSSLYLAVARRRRHDVDLEAERRVAERRLNEAKLDEARRDVARTLMARIGREIVRLSAEAEGATGAGDARARLEAVVNPAPESGTFLALDELISRIDAKCRRLCEEIRFESLVLEGTDAATPRVDDASASALVVLAQELVRNAVVRGSAKRVDVELLARGDEVVLRVRDDGVGLSPSQLARSTGGLENARRWVGARGGALELEAPPFLERGTSLTVRLLAPSRPPAASSTFSE